MENIRKTTKITNLYFKSHKLGIINRDSNDNNHDRDLSIIFMISVEAGSFS